MWLALRLVDVVVIILAVGLSSGVILFGFSFALAPIVLFRRHPLTAPYARQPPPPRLGKAFLREVWSAFLFYGSFMAWPLIGGYENRPGQQRVPVVFVHGVWVSRSSWFWFMRMLAQRGVARPMYALAFNWLAPVERSSVSLARLIDRALEEQQATQVDLVAHSWGGFVSRWYIEKLGRAASVRQLILIGSPMRGTWMGVLGVGATKRQMFVGSSTVMALATAPPAPRYSTLWSDCDEIVVPPQMSVMLDQGRNQGAVRQFHGIGHLTMQRDPDVADAVAALLESPPDREA